MTFRTFIASVASLVAAGLLTACGAPATKACVPGQSTACAGASGCAGAQACLPDGTGYGACQCSTGGTGGGTGGGVGGGSGGGVAGGAGGGETGAGGGVGGGAGGGETGAGGGVGGGTGGGEAGAGGGVGGGTGGGETGAGGGVGGGVGGGGGGAGGGTDAGVPDAGVVRTCAPDNGGCSAAATCTDTPSGRVCTCSPGYAGDGFSCTDIDECLTANGGCDPLTSCTNTIGSRICGACPRGYTGSGDTCCTCTNLCLRQQTCASPGATTSITGTVFAPGHVGDPAFPSAGSADPIPNAIVYVPNGLVPPFSSGVACGQCSDGLPGDVLLSTITDSRGQFTLQNMPVGDNISLVIQIGRWRRTVTLPTITACVNTPLSPELTRLPRTHAEGDIPQMAIVTGAEDSFECLLRRIGVADSEFTVPTGSGRVHLYTGQGAGGATLGVTQPTENQLWGAQAIINRYDSVFLSCQGAAYAQTSVAQQTLANYLSAGGRVLATHYSYVWLDSPALASAAWWHVDQQPPPVDQTGYVDQTFPKGMVLAQWLQYVSASTSLGQVPLTVLRQDLDGVNTPTQAWLGIETPATPALFTFNTPLGAPAAQQCGRAVFDDFHVENAVSDPSVRFPAECVAGPMTPQQKLMEFMFFDLGSCVTADVPTCTPLTCTQLNAACGPAGDGCGGVLQCGPCPSGLTCASAPARCSGATSCQPRTCVQLGATCGPVADGCGGLLQCGSCIAPQLCGGLGVPNTCG
jgi:EGF domain